MLAAALMGGVSAASTASAAGFTCDATAVRGSVLGQALPAPVTANVGASACKAAKGGGASLLPPPLATSVIFAETGLTGRADNVAGQTATAAGGLADLRLLPLPQLPIQAQLDQLAASLPKIVLPLPTSALPLGLPIPGLPSQVTLDVSQAVRALLQPQGELLRIQGGVAYASAKCADGALALNASSRVAGLSVLGQELPVDQVVTQAINIVGTGSISPSQLDLTQIVPQGIAPELVATVQAALRPALLALPPIQIPPLLANVRITPGGQTKTATKITQRALDVHIDIAGQPILDAQIGEASAGAVGVQCSSAPPATIQQAALQCTTRKLTLIDVFQRDGRVQLYGAADKKLIGKTVDIFFRHDNRRVARAKVREDGTFKTTAKLPARKLRGTNRARYQARSGKERSLDLKLQRRMVVESVRVAGGKVRIAGQVTRPLAKPTKTIEVRQRISCSKTKVVARVKPDADGRFRVTVAAPPSQLAAVYRFATRVRKTTRNPKTFPTFTLPRYVDLS